MLSRNLTAQRNVAQATIDNDKGEAEGYREQPFIVEFSRRLIIIVLNANVRVSPADRTSLHRRQKIKALAQTSGSSSPVYLGLGGSSSQG